MIDIYVDAAAQPNGSGTSGSPFRTMSDAVDKANLTGDATIHVAKGNYNEAGLVIKAWNVKIRGTTILARDTRGLPTGSVVDAAQWNHTPGGGTLLTVRAPHFEVSGIVFDGAPSKKGILLVIDGGDSLISPRPSLDGILIRGNCFQDAAQGASIRLANAMIEGNFIGRNAIGLNAAAGFKPPPNAWPEQLITFRGNRVLDNVNLGVAFAGHVGSNFSGLTSFAAGPGSSRVVVTNNDFTGNGDARTPLPGNVYYPQSIQYTGLLFNVMHGTNSDPQHGAEVHASITDNTFIKNGYGVAVSQRLPQAANIVGYAFEASLSGNTYCSNGLNHLFADFNLITQSHGVAPNGGPFRYAIDTVYNIDATGDGLTLSDIDYDHLEIEPLPPGNIRLNNHLIFNGLEILPAKKITIPPLARIETVDRTRPILSVNAVPAVLWPPDGTMVPVSIAVDAKDGCDPNPKTEIVQVTHNQLGLFGSQVPYGELVGPLSLRLRAEREANAGSRVYSITVRCTDEKGNSSFRDAIVTVPLCCAPHAAETGAGRR